MKCITYTKPLIDGLYQVSPARSVPAHITRPSYVGQQVQTPKDLNNTIQIHTPKSIAQLRTACKVAAGALQTVLTTPLPSIKTTDDIDMIVHNHIVSQHAYPSPIDFLHFPKSVCTSVNEVICHGIPDNRPLCNCDYINVDITSFKDNAHGDTSAMLYFENTHSDVIGLIQHTRLALMEAIKICKPGVNFNMIGKTIEEVARCFGHEVCDIFTGHGIGHEMHMPPYVHHKYKKCSEVMEVGMAFTIEPILLLKPTKFYRMWKDGWTIVSNMPSAQWEHTLLVTNNGCEVLTLREGEVLA
jgi:methionyl aminopeptidase